MITVERTETQITLSRHFAAPRELVFEAFRVPELLVQWWAPRPWKVPYCTVDFRPGGVWHYCLQGPQGETVWVKALYHEIVVPELVVYADGFVDAEGNPKPELPHGITRVTFAPEGTGTLLRSQVTYLAAEDVKTVVRMGMVEGVEDSWSLLAELVEAR